MYINLITPVYKAVITTMCRSFVKKVYVGLNCKSGRITDRLKYNLSMRLQKYK